MLKLHYIRLSKDHCDTVLQDFIKKQLSPESILLLAQMIGCEANNQRTQKDYPSTLIQWSSLKQIYPNIGKQHCLELVTQGFIMPTGQNFKVVPKLITNYVSAEDPQGINFTDFIIKHFKNSLPDSALTELIAQIESLKVFQQKATKEINALRAKVKELEQNA